MSRLALTVLSLDTTTREGSCAVVRGGLVLHETVGDGSRTHGERLPQDLIRLLADADVSLAEIDLLAVAAGPGSFTGLRVGIATVQGLSIALGRPVIAVSSLEALARAFRAGRTGGSPEAVVAPWIDALRGEVFAVAYDARADNVLIEPAAGSPADALDRVEAVVRDERVHFVGDGAMRYRAEIAMRFQSRADVFPMQPLAGAIGLIASAEPARAASPHSVVPIYLRRPDAELARARRET